MHQLKNYAHVLDTRISQKLNHFKGIHARREQKLAAGSEKHRLQLQITEQMNGSNDSQKLS